MRFFFCRWLQNHTLTTFFDKSSFSAIEAILSLEGLGFIAKYASNERFSAAPIDVRFLFLSEFGKKALFMCFVLYAFSASSSHAVRTGFKAIMLLWLSVSDSNLQIVDWLSEPTPGIFRCARAEPTSAWVTPSFILRCLNLSANHSNSLGFISSFGAERDAWVTTVWNDEEFWIGAVVPTGDGVSNGLSKADSLTVGWRDAEIWSRISCAS